MSKRPSVPNSASQGEEFALRVLRVEAAETLTVVFRTASVTGCFTHFVKGRSRYCDPDVCKWGCPRLERTWKGYDLVDCFEPRSSMWVPWVLEITEHLELDLRGRYARGHSWQLARAAEAKDHRSPVVGKFLGVVPADRVQPTVNFDAVLRTLFHVERISLDVRNPMPDRILVTAHKEAMLPAQAVKVEEPCGEDQLERMRRQMGKPSRNSTAEPQHH
jgi:hypothetical protein